LPSKYEINLIDYDLIKSR